MILLVSEQIRKIKKLKQKSMSKRESKRFFRNWNKIDSIYNDKEIK